jgi:hypothetical protein
MRSVNLIKAVIEAEVLRYKSMAARQGRRAGFGVAALIFGVGFLITLEIAGWQTARIYILPIFATLCVMGFNFLIAAGFARGRDALQAGPVGDRRAGGQEEGRAGAADLTIRALVPAAGYQWDRRGKRRLR